MDKRQERGLLVLIFIIILAIVFNRYAPRIFTRSEESLIETMVHVEKLPVNLSNEKALGGTLKNKTKVVKLKISRFFDPNTISLEDLMETKLPSYIAENWIKYRNNGAIFNEPEDVAKIYGLSDDLFNQLKSWIRIPHEKLESKPNSDGVTGSKKSGKNELSPNIAKEIVLGINSADSVGLLNVNGIGPFYAGAIVKYRERLGGYRSLGQLMELYKMDSSKLEQILPQLYLDTLSINRIALNTAEFKEILKHPYIDYETTKYLVNKRNKLGKYAALYQLKDSVYMPDSLFRKLLPYIKLDD